MAQGLNFIKRQERRRREERWCSAITRGGSGGSADVVRIEVFETLPILDELGYTQRLTFFPHTTIPSAIQIKHVNSQMDAIR